MRTIWKYPVEPAAVLWVPAGARPLRAMVQDGQLCIWYEVDPDRPKERRLVMVCGTGQPAPDDRFRHIDSLIDGPYVWHVYEGKDEAPPGD